MFRGPAAEHLLSYLNYRQPLLASVSFAGNHHREERPWHPMSSFANSRIKALKLLKDSPKRAEAFKQMAKTLGVTVKEILWTQGRYDIVALTEAPDELSGTALNLSLSSLGNIRTKSLRAFSADEMAKVVAKMV